VAGRCAGFLELVSPSFTPGSTHLRGFRYLECRTPPWHPLAGILAGSGTASNAKFIDCLCTVHAGSGSRPNRFRPPAASARSRAGSGRATGLEARSEFGRSDRNLHPCFSQNAFRECRKHPTAPKSRRRTVGTHRRTRRIVAESETTCPASARTVDLAASRDVRTPVWRSSALKAENCELHWHLAGRTKKEPAPELRNRPRRP
jgi:hypothetical protein